MDPRESSGRHQGRRRPDYYDADRRPRSQRESRKRRGREDREYRYSRSMSPEDRRSRRGRRNRRSERSASRSYSEGSRIDSDYDRRHHKRRWQRSRSRSPSRDRRSRGEERLEDYRRRDTDNYYEHSGRDNESRRKRRRRKERYRDRSSASSSSSRRPHHPPAEALSRAGVVSDDGDDEENSAPLKHRDAQPDARTKHAVLESPSDDNHDDTVGHFRGGPGTIVADRYRIIKEVGLGTFGRVVECFDTRARTPGRRRQYRDADSSVAIKIVRNVQRYHESALIEANIVEAVNRRGGRGMTHCVVMHDAFSFNGHYCMVFENLGPSLYDFLKRHKYQPFPMICVQDFTVQLLETLEFLHSFRLIHTDLKIENILLMNDREVNYGKQRLPESTRIKLCDFGGACYDNDKKSSVINTRQYRAPEVILGSGWSMPSDMWSVGCILAELYQGELLFATHDNIEHLALMERIIGPFPRWMIKAARNNAKVDAKKAFDSGGRHRMDRVLPPESVSFVKKSSTLESIIRKREDSWFLSLLRMILVIDPAERATAHECLQYLSRIGVVRRSF